MAEDAYAQAVKHTFEIRPLRTVLIIDDQFPTYTDLGVDKDVRAHFKETDRALALYEGFKARHMLCDVENAVDPVTVDRTRKSDLIVLDYNLGPTENDNRRAVNLLRSLAASSHFNTVLIYTADDLDRVWLEVAASLRGDWDDSPTASLSTTAITHWEKLSDNDELPRPTRALLMAYVCRTSVRGLPAESLRDELIALEVPQSECTAIVEALLRRELAQFAGEFARCARTEVRGACSTDGARWLQTRNCFVAFLGKTTQQGVADDAAGVMAELSRALLSWRPNLFHMLVSEIQNILELEALATEDEHLRDIKTQVGLWYYLLSSVLSVDVRDPKQMRAPLEALVDKVVDGIRRRLSADNELLELLSAVAVEEIASLRWTPETVPMRASPQLFKAAETLTRLGSPQDKAAVLHRLNTFLSIEPFRLAHLTTGTLFCSDGHNILWVAASPACDMTTREPTSAQEWSRSLHPRSVLVTLRLRQAESVTKALNDAEEGQHIFINVDGQDRAYRLLDPVTRQPAYELLFPAHGGRVERGGLKDRFTFSALCMVGSSEGLHSNEQEFTVVGQLRSANANRVLQLAGQHLSRIGLDFLKMPV